MAAPARPTRLRARTCAAWIATLAAVAVTGGCGSDAGSAARAAREHTETAPQPRSACPDTVLHTFGQIAKRIYGEGVHSERTRVAERFIARSRPLREAVEHDNPAATAAAARALIAT